MYMEHWWFDTERMKSKSFLNGLSQCPFVHHMYVPREVSWYQTRASAVTAEMQCRIRSMLHVFLDRRSKC